MKTFEENLSVLPVLDGLSVLHILDAHGTIQASIKNETGTQGSFRVYYHVASKWGELGPEAAREALEIYAEHTEDAMRYPGKHPNIDRLFDILRNNFHYSVQIL